jgi:hypothetical protein
MGHVIPQSSTHDSDPPVGKWVNGVMIDKDGQRWHLGSSAGIYPDPPRPPLHDLLLDMATALDEALERLEAVEDRAAQVEYRLKSRKASA